jgi:DNA polymerase-3 subunit alpha
MMFATLDDLEGSIELVIFGKALAACEDAAVADAIVVIRGRVDHKDRDKTCLIVQQLERFEPSPDELRQAAERAAVGPKVASALRLRLDARSLQPSALSELKELLAGFPGESEVVIELETSGGPRRLRLGSEFKVALGAPLVAELDALLGSAMLATAAPNTAPDEVAAAVASA